MRMLECLVSPCFAFMGISGGEMLVIAVVALLIFGRRLPEVMRSMGKGVAEFKKGIKDMEREVREAEEAPPKAAAARKAPTEPQVLPPPPPPPPPPGP